MLTVGGSCREAVRKFLAWLALSEDRTASPNTAAYCKARARLPLADLEKLHRKAVRAIESSAPQALLFHGRPVKVVDGSSASMPDTHQNQQAYPQHKGQKPGCGFPLLRFVGLFSLFSGVLIGWATGNLHSGERPLFRRLWDLLRSGDILLGDCGFTGFADIYLLHLAGVDCVLPNHQSRKRGLQTVRSLGKGNRLVRWFKTSRCPPWMDKTRWRSLPDSILLREFTFTAPVRGRRTRTFVIVTTLTDSKAFPKPDLVALYHHRWQAELYFRDIKVALAMDPLSCLSPAMIEKELALFFIAYNLIRAVMLQAALRHDLSPWRISFQGAVSTLRTWALPLASPLLSARQRKRLTELLLLYLARDPVPLRPGRQEPRVRKRRPKNYPLLTQSRHLFVEIPHKNKYKKRLS